MMSMHNSFASLLALSRFKKRFLQVLADALLVGLCFYFAMFLRLENVEFSSNPKVWLALLPVFPVTIFVFRALNLYRSVLRFITLAILKTITLGAVVSSVTLLLSSHMMDAPVPRSVPGIYALLLIMTAGGLRFLLQGIFRKQIIGTRKPVAIYGAGESGRQLQSALRNMQDYVPVVFIDDEPSMHNTLVGGKLVISSDRLEHLEREFGVKTVLLAIPSASRSERRAIIAKIERVDLEVKTIPGMEDILSGRAEFSELRSITPEDLLGRDAVPPKVDLMRRNITGKTVLVSGAGGSIGSELCRQILEHDPAKLVLLEVSEYALYKICSELRERLAHAGRKNVIEPILGSVQNPGRVDAVLRAFGVQTVYHAAAYKHVVMVEENVVEGIRNNIFGTKVIAQAAADNGVENFILISTDKAVRPTNIMGASKRAAELVCQDLASRSRGTNFSIVRFGNVLGSSGSVIPRFEAQIQAGGPVTVTHRDITRYFMTIPEASQLVIQAGAMSRGGDVFILDMGEPVKIFELAKSMIWLKGLQPYVLDPVDENDPLEGDVGIQIIGLQKGEKLYEELLIGNNPRPTDHPRIMTATEVSLSEAKLRVLLEELHSACLAFDVSSIQQILLEAPLAYQPTEEALHDLMWRGAQSQAEEKRDFLLTMEAGE
jgi:FlaA1/EpsC-like NDP-sugar epimerase